MSDTLTLTHGFTQKNLYLASKPSDRTNKLSWPHWQPNDGLTDG